MSIILNSVFDLFSLIGGEIISKRNMMDLIQYSKVKGSKYWYDEENIINNTPQQGINPIGKYPNLKGVILKSKSGVYNNDGWRDHSLEFDYAFKANKGYVNFNDLANKSLIEQVEKKYPLFLFIEDKKTWRFEGRFAVLEKHNSHVTLIQFENKANEIVIELSNNDNMELFEGEKKLKTHYRIERNAKVISLLKQLKPNICEICNLKFEKVYGVNYIEAHHIKPLASIEGRRKVNINDFALLCPNCHKAVHLHLLKNNNEFDKIIGFLKNQVKP